MPLDLNETITEGEFAGLTVKQLMDHTAAVNAALAEGRQPPAPPARPTTPPPTTPAARLDNDAAQRVDPSLMFTWQRLEQDDEAEFIRTSGVTDYEEYRADILKAKEPMAPAVRIQKGLHARLYELKKMERHPELRASIYGAVQPPPPPGGEPPVVPPVTPTPTAPPPAAPFTPQAAPPSVPPVARPTPVSRTPPTDQKPKLKANVKITQLAAASNMTVDELLLDYEARGLTQDDIDRLSAPSRASQPHRSTAYGRQRAGR